MCHKQSAIICVHRDMTHSHFFISLNILSYELPVDSSDGSSPIHKSHIQEPAQKLRATQTWTSPSALPVNRIKTPSYQLISRLCTRFLFDCPNGHLLLYLLLSPYPTSKTICSPRRLLKIKSVELQYLIFEKSNKVENEKKI